MKKEAEEIEMYIRAYSDVLLEEGEVTIHIGDLKELIKRVSQSYSDQENDKLMEKYEDSLIKGQQLCEDIAELQKEKEELENFLDNSNLIKEKAREMDEKQFAQWIFDEVFKP